MHTPYLKVQLLNALSEFQLVENAMSDEWLNLTEAAEIAGCSRKTLYRYMEKGVLAYEKRLNNRRYVEKERVEKLFKNSIRSTVHTAISRADIIDLVSLLDELKREIESQTALLVKMIELYKPNSVADILRKYEKAG